MSSPPQLHLSLPPNTTFKRSFENYLLESPASSVPRAHESIDTPESSSTISSDGDENRRKRPRSASSLSDPEDRSSEASSSTLSSFDSDPASDHSISSHPAARRHLLLDLGLGRGLGSSVALGLSLASPELQLASAIPEPPPRIPTPDLLESEDIDMPDVDMVFSHTEEHEREPPSHAEHVRRSVDRFNAFERHISVLRSSSPPVIPLPASLHSRQASLSPPTLPPLPLVDLGLDADDDDDDQDQIPSTNTSTPPRLDLNLPLTTSLSSPTAPPEQTPSTQFRERLDSAIDGPPILPPLQQPTDDELDHYFEPSRNSAADATAAGGSRTRPLAETSVFDWEPALNWDATLGPSRRPAPEAAQPLRSSAWRPHVRPANATAVMDTTSADIRRFIGRSYSPPAPHPPPPTRVYPRAASLAAPLSVPASTLNSELDADIVDAYLDFHRNSSNTRAAWESALDRARASQRERERESERIRVLEREERERERQRMREEEAEREMEERPWSLDSIWEANRAEASASSSSARARPWESLTLRSRRELAEDSGERELDVELTRRIHRQIRTERERESRRDEQLERGQSSVARAARYLESGLVDPREASPPGPGTSAAPPARERRLHPLSNTSNPFNVSWGPSRRPEMTVEEEPPASRPATHRSRSSSQSRDSGSIDWIARGEQNEEDHFDTFDDWFNLESDIHTRIGAPRTAGSSGAGHTRNFVIPLEEGSSSGEFWRPPRSGLQPRLAVSPQSTALPARTATHARAQSIPASSLGTIAPQPSLHRLRSRLYGPSRAAGVGSSNSLVAENAAAIRRREARSELLERLNAFSDFDAGWEPRAARQSAREARADDPMDSEDDSLTRRVADAFEWFGARAPPPPPLRAMRFHRRSDASPPRESSPLPLRLPSGSASTRPWSTAARGSDQEAEDETTASSSGLNSRRPLTIHPRRSVQRLRQHPISISGEISPPPPASTTVDRRHVSWEAPSRDTGVSSTYEYLSALSHGFDSQSSSISDMAHTIASNSHAEEARRSPASPMWGEHESPFSTLFGRGPALQRNVRRGQRGADDTMDDAPEDSSVPSLPPPDLGRNFERPEDVLTSAHAEARPSSSSSALAATLTSDSPSTSYIPRPPTPPSASGYTGPFALTMQRREEFARARNAARQRRIPDPPSLPPLQFGDFEHPTASPLEEGSSTRRHNPQRPLTYQTPSSRSELPSARFADAERRLFHYRGPTQVAQVPDGDPRRFFPSRPTTTASTSHVERDTAEQRGLRSSTADIHSVLARHARLEGSRLADLPRSPRPEAEGLDHEGFSARAQRLISRFHEAEAEAREPSASSSTTHWAELPSRRTEAPVRPDVEARRRRAMASRADGEPVAVGLRHRAFRDPAFHPIFAPNHGLHGAATARFRRRALGDYVRDEDFDGSYETLLTLSGIIGDAKPKATPDDIVSGLETASYKDWATSESDQRCPICLDDYQSSDPVMKLGDCRHWLHKECLEQWLKGASTCPVCRKDVKGKARRAPHHHHHHHPQPGPSRRRDGDPDGPDGPGPAGGSGWDTAHIEWLNYLRD